MPLVKRPGENTTLMTPLNDLLECMLTIPIVTLCEQTHAADMP